MYKKLILSQRSQLNEDPWFFVLGFLSTAFYTFSLIIYRCLRNRSKIQNQLQLLSLTHCLRAKYFFVILEADESCQRCFSSLSIQCPGPFRPWCVVGDSIFSHPFSVDISFIQSIKAKWAPLQECQKNSEVSHEIHFLVKIRAAEIQTSLLLEFILTLFLEHIFCSSWKSLWSNDLRQCSGKYHSL